jgi:hypothetical protein
VSRAAVAVATVTLLAPSARATQRFGPLQLSGNLQTQNLVRHADAASYDFIQQPTSRGSVSSTRGWRARLLDAYDVPFVERSRLLVQWRGVTTASTTRRRASSPRRTSTAARTAVSRCSGHGAGRAVPYARRPRP